MAEQGYDQKKNGRRLCHNIMTARRRDKEKGQEWLFERKKQVEHGYKKHLLEQRRTRGLQEEEKQAQLRHAAKQRNTARCKALETLAVEVQKRKD